MGVVVYSGSALNAFGSSLLTVLILTVSGIAGLGMGILRRREKAISRIAMGLAGGLLCIAAAVMIFFTVRSYTGGAETITALLNKKRVVTENCDNGSSTCTRYVLEMQSNANFYDVAVGLDAFDSVDESACYAITYYPNHGLFGGAQSTDSYQTIGGVTQIVTAACP